MDDRAFIAPSGCLNSKKPSRSEVAYPKQTAPVSSFAQHMLQRQSSTSERLYDIASSHCHERARKAVHAWILPTKQRATTMPGALPRGSTSPPKPSLAGYSIIPALPKCPQASALSTVHSRHLHQGWRNATLPVILGRLEREVRRLVLKLELHLCVG